MTAATPTLDLADIQGGILHPRPSPYVGDLPPAAHRRPARRPGDAAAAARRRSPRRPRGRADERRLAQRGADLPRPGGARRSRRTSLATFAPEFREGMAARADGARRRRGERAGTLGAPARHRRRPRRAGRDRAATQPRTRRAAGPARGRPTPSSPGVRVIWRQDCYALPTEREASGSGTASAIRPSRAAGSRAATRTRRRCGRASSSSATSTRPAICRRSRSRRRSAATAPTWCSASCTRTWPRSAGTCATTPPSPEDEELLAAKFVGRWRSGAPLALAPEHDDPELGADPARNNDFRYRADDERGLRCPIGRTSGG